MDYIFNTKKLEQALSDFYNSTGIAVALYNASKNTVAGSPVYSRYCSCVRKYHDCIEHCNQSNLIHMKEVSSTGQIIRYTCHAGLMETILPVVYDGVLIAYIQIGQFRDAENRYSNSDNLKKVSKQYGIPLRELSTLYKKLPVVSEEKLRSLYHIVDILVKSFWIDGLITYNRSMQSVKIERFIDEHLGEKIGPDYICNKFFLSKNAVYQLFRNEFNTSVNDYIIKKKLMRAQEVLKTDFQLNVTQIASTCGFADYNYFIRLFKKQFGVTPLQFRKNSKKND